MKTLLALITALLIHFVGEAQENLYYQDFEGTDEEVRMAGWESVDLHGSSDFCFGIFSTSPFIAEMGFKGNTMGGMTFDIAVSPGPSHNPNTDIAFKTQEYSLPAKPCKASYRIGSVAFSNNSSSHYSVYIVTREELALIRDEAQLKAFLDKSPAVDTGTVTGQSTINTLDLSAYSLKTIRLVFRLHESPTDTFLLFDEVTIQYK